jgi:hypothetical protein
MKSSKKAMLAGLATAATLGYAAKKRHDNNKSPARKFMEKLEDYIDRA